LATYYYNALKTHLSKVTSTGLGIRETDRMAVGTATPIGVIIDECKKTPKMAFNPKVRELYKSGCINLFDHH
jgi:acid stress chaperone HdeA